ncbi:MAG: nitroreductase family protein [Thermomicrobiales bacterium]|nr:nitroreductase family protein [Thermomicrobiales bacterium]
MASEKNAHTCVEEMRQVRQARKFLAQPVADDLLHEVLEVARWTGSSRNTQPWRLIVVTDRAQLRQIGALRAPIAWVADAPLAIAIVLDGDNPTTESYDEGRLSERVLIAAQLLGLGGGVAWYGDAGQQAQAKRVLGIPEERAAHSMIVLGYPETTKDHRPNPAQGGRMPLTELVSYARLGERAK